VTDFADVHMNPAALERYGLPDIRYPVPVDRLDDLFTAHRDLDLAELLLWLQQGSSEAGRGFRQYEPAMARLATLLTPAADTRETVTVMGKEWWLELGPVDLEGEVVSIQRDYELVAALGPRDDGRLRAAVFRPLDTSSVEQLLTLAQDQPYGGSVPQRASHWQHACDVSAGRHQRDAAEADRAYLSYWQHGLGTLHDQTASPVYLVDRLPTPRRPAEVATEIGIHYKGSAAPG
jgi:hypothetical protein